MAFRRTVFWWALAAAGAVACVWAVGSLRGVAGGDGHRPPPSGVAGWSVVAAAFGAVAGGALLWAVGLRLRRSQLHLQLLALRHEQPPEPEALLRCLETFQRLLRPAAIGVALGGRPWLGLELFRHPEGSITFAICVPAALAPAAGAALRAAYPNLELVPFEPPVPNRSAHLLYHRRPLAERAPAVQPRFGGRLPIESVVNQLASCSGAVAVALWLRPASPLAELLAQLADRSRALPRPAQPPAGRRPPDRLAPARGGLFHLQAVVCADRREEGRAVAAALCAQRGDGELGVRRCLAARRVGRAIAAGSGPLSAGGQPTLIAAGELLALWQLPGAAFAGAPLARGGAGATAAPSGSYRPRGGAGLLRDRLGPVSIHPATRNQNLALPGAVGQGKTSVLLASFAEDLRRSHCCVILLDPKGDAAEAALALVEPERPCTVLDLAHPTCGFNPLAANAPADVVADQVVEALRNLFSEAEIRASSDRYLRNAIIAVLAAEPRPTLWDAARLLSVGPDGYAYRERVGSRVRELPELKEVSEFFAGELSAQLHDARTQTTAKLDAPVNKLARLLNSPSIKRVLLNRSLTIDFDRIIAGREVLIVKGALGTMGAGNTSVVLQLLVGMLDAALARQQDGLAGGQPVAVALKVDEAPLAINRGFARTLALKRSAGLETVAAWQTDSQWEEELRGQLDALFAHRIYFATASYDEALRSARLLGGGPDPEKHRAGYLATPQARLELPPHHGIASLVSPAGRLAPFIGATLPFEVDPERARQARLRQQRRGGRYLAELAQPDWRGQSPDRLRVRLAAVTPAPDETGTPPAALAELLALEGAVGAREASGPEAVFPHEPDQLDLALLLDVARLGLLSTGMLHRRHGAGRSLSSTQRRLKRLAEAALLRRYQLHRADGGLLPLTYGCTPAAVELVAEKGLGPGPPTAPPAAPTARQLRQLLATSGWLLAYERLSEGGPVALWGAAGAGLEPKAGGRLIGPFELRLPGGRVAHCLWGEGQLGRGEGVPFESVRADGLAQPGGGLELFVERDDRLLGEGIARKLRRWDRFLSGWCWMLPRYRERDGLGPFVVFLCRSRKRAAELAGLADRLVVGAQAYPGEPPQRWLYPGRERTLFCAAHDLYRGERAAIALERLPPRLRGAERGEGRFVALPGL